MRAWALATSVLLALLLAGCEGTPPQGDAPAAATDASSTAAPELPQLPDAPALPVTPTTQPPAPAAPIPPSDPLHWSGTVDVTESRTILPWQALTIAPGTTVRFAKGTIVPGTDWMPQADAFIKDHNDPTGRVGYQQGHVELIGKVVAVGTRDAPIVFTSADPNPGYADWNKLVLLAGSRLENVTVAYSHNGITVQGDDVVLRNVTAHDSLWSCIDVFGARARLVDIEAYHCWHQAVGFKAHNGGSVAGAFLHDSTLSVNCEGGADPTLAGLTLRAARLSPFCPPAVGTVQIPGGADTPGGTYDGALVYPAT